MSAVKLRRLPEGDDIEGREVHLYRVGTAELLEALSAGHARTVPQPIRPEAELGVVETEECREGASGCAGPALVGCASRSPTPPSFLTRRSVACVVGRPPRAVSSGATSKRAGHGRPRACVSALTGGDPRPGGCRYVLTGSRSASCLVSK